MKAPDIVRQDVTMVCHCGIIEIQGLLSKMSHFVPQLGGMTHIGAENG